MKPVLVIWCLAGGVYLLFAGTASLHELATAIVIATFGTGWAYIIRRSSPRDFAVSAELVRLVLRTLRNLPQATARTGKVLWHVILRDGSPGRSYLASFPRDGREGATERLRWAIGVVLESVSPDRFVVEVDRNHGNLLNHSLLRRSRAAESRRFE